MSPNALLQRIARSAAFLLFALALPWPHCGLAAGILHLPRAELRLESGKTPGELLAENRGDSPLYLDVEQQLLLNPGSMPEVLVPVGETEQPGLLVTPNRLVLAPGQKYRMNLRILTPPARTQVWRITFRPRERVILEPGEAHGSAAPLIINMAYGVLIYQIAESAQP
ncbi:hypothetical protein [Achromobacter anxifer]|jgi:hypothetical protein|uniref:Pili assembly chaperone N-terminal domain-containing protein n=1 Tax=Achromobacter anxifer TaxID=1287737 RepID=A0A6S7C9N0_9BURK|nr:hypothetical protein [Achromobacter anxifer]MDF8361470.1 hypothetical protein [Achromobacter anxifer]CAB3820896.1 hypothetical protein LMG26858_00189 [Achromobacter anxifer]CAB5513185.1 hypothetical protein LMG26857_02462 [Achromobacter anxifer]